MYDVGVEEGYVYLDGSFHRFNVYVQDEKIAILTEEKLQCRKRIVATGKYVLPGFIDPHVHFALGVGDTVSKDDFYTGSMEAARGGITTYIDFLDPVNRADQIGSSFSHRMQMAKPSIVDYGFHTTIANPLSLAKDIMEECKKVGITSIKLFTTYSETNRRTYDDKILELLSRSNQYGMVIVVHSENDDLIRKNKDILVRDHEKARPALVENIEVLKLAQMAKATGGTLYLVHVSAGSSVELLVHNFRKEITNQQIIIESCPHYFTLNAERLEKEEGYKYTMTPPIREEKERILLHQYINDIHTIGTDHCPYTKQQKQHLYTSEIAMGIGGMRYSFLNMYQEFGFSILDKFTKGPADVYHLKHKGRLLPGYDADIVLFDHLQETIVDDEMSVYDKRKYRGRIESVWVRGNQVLHQNKVGDNVGKYIKRGE